MRMSESYFIRFAYFSEQEGKDCFFHVDLLGIPERGDLVEIDGKFREVRCRVWYADGSDLIEIKLQ